MNQLIVENNTPLNRQNIQTVFSHASECYPEEACGFVYLDGSVHAGSNIQNSLHCSDPERYQRDAHTAFTFSVADMHLLATSFCSGNPVSIIYHSHPDVGAYFSREDTDKALFMGRPVHPVMHLVVDVRKRVAKGALLFRWNGFQFEQCQSYCISGSTDTVSTEKEDQNEYV